MPGKKRANQPGYIQKVNARGHKYWAKQPNNPHIGEFSGSILSDEDWHLDGNALSNQGCQEEILDSGLSIGDVLDVSIGDEPQPGWNVVGDYYGDMVMEAPSGQHYAIIMSVLDEGVSIEPVSCTTFSIKSYNFHKSRLSHQPTLNTLGECAKGHDFYYPLTEVMYEAFKDITKVDEEWERDNFCIEHEKWRNPEYTTFVVGEDEPHPTILFFKGTDIDNLPVKTQVSAHKDFDYDECVTVTTRKGDVDAKVFTYQGYDEVYLD